MVPMPRLMLLLHLFQVPNYRYFKAGSPSRNWIMNPKSRGLPPQYPCRRGSTAPISSLVLTSTSSTPNRSRSLDGLLDSESKISDIVTEISPNPSESADKGCNDYDSNTDKQTDMPTDFSKIKAHSLDDILVNNNNYNNSGEWDKHSIDSTSSESKRKKKFMDRCVNKVRSLIKK